MRQTILFSSKITDACIGLARIRRIEARPAFVYTLIFNIMTAHRTTESLEQRLNNLLLEAKRCVYRLNFMLFPDHKKKTS